MKGATAGLGEGWRRQDGARRDGGGRRQPLLS